MKVAIFSFWNSSHTLKTENGIFTSWIKFIFLLSMLVLIACNPMLNKKTVELAGTPRGGDFSIPSTVGSFNTSDYRGEILFIFFGFSHCPYICPTTLKNLSLMKKKLSVEDQKRVRILFISIDNENDTLQSLKEINTIYGDRIVSATDTDHNLREIAIKFGAGFSKRKNIDGEWIFEHTDKVYVINSKGQWVDSKPYNVTADVFKQSFLEADTLAPLSSKSQHRRLEVWGENLDCDLSLGPCSAKVDEKVITLKITPTPIKVTRPLLIEVETHSNEIVAIETDLVGFGENMGHLRPALSKSTAEIYSGQVTLPVCEIAEMYWLVRLLLKKDGKEGVVEFKFKTKQTI